MEDIVKRKERQRRYRERLKGNMDYAEDETRGVSQIRPIRYKKDVPVQAWMESRYLATLSEWLDKFGRSKYLSEVVQEGIRVVVDNLVEAGEVEMVEDVFEAREMLEWKYKVKLRDIERGTRGKSNLHHNAVLGERRKELGRKMSYMKREIDSRGIPIIEKGVVGESMSKEKVEEMKEKSRRDTKIYEELKRKGHEEEMRAIDEAIFGKESDHNPTIEEIEAKDKLEAKMDMTAPNNRVVKLEGVK